MPSKNELMRRLKMIHPVIQAPLAGGGDTPELIAAVGEAGGLGFIGAAYLTPQQILEAARAARTLTARPFGISLFAPQPLPDPPKDPRAALECVAPFYAELGLPPPQPPAVAADSFGEQLAAALEGGASVFSFTFGILPASAIQTVKARGMFLIGTATTVDEAVTLEGVGVDAVVTQGAEAGGHRGSFAAEFETAMVGTISLVPQVVDAVRIPVIASGGIMDGRGIAAALTLGAQAVQMGTAFLTCDEAGIPDRRPRRRPSVPVPERADAAAAQRGSQTGTRGIPFAVGGSGCAVGAASAGRAVRRTTHPGDRRSHSRVGNAGLKPAGGTPPHAAA